MAMIVVVKRDHGVGFVPIWLKSVAERIYQHEVTFIVFLDMTRHFLDSDLSVVLLFDLKYLMIIMNCFLYENVQSRLFSIQKALHGIQERRTFINVRVKFVRKDPYLVLGMAKSGRYHQTGMSLVTIVSHVRPLFFQCGVQPPEIVVQGLHSILRMAGRTEAASDAAASVLPRA